jgi:homoserine O-succinyltransferase
MPILLDRPAQAHALQPPEVLGPSDGPFVEIALVNNMPDAALESTERQFFELLEAAAGALPVRLRLVSLPEVPRGDAARQVLERGYCDIAELRDAHPDGIIVTGTEPRAPSLRDEPYWAALADLVDWAEHNGIASIWSCLAAHAAVLHRDGIARRALPDKCFGLFACGRLAEHALATGLPGEMQIAHSRWNELPEDALRAAGYQVLTRSAVAGVDTFVKETNSLALFFQGHPEYDSSALLREYRRDVGRYLRGERDTYPTMPFGYFGERATLAAAAFRARAEADRRDDLMADFPTSVIDQALTPQSAAAATRVYANWLAQLARHKAQNNARRMDRMRSPRMATHVSAD